MIGFSVSSRDVDGYMFIAPTKGVYSVHAFGKITLDYRREDVLPNGPLGTDMFEPDENWVTKNAKSGQLVIVKDGEYIPYEDGIKINIKTSEEVIFIINDRLPRKKGELGGYGDNEGTFDVVLMFRGERLKDGGLITEYQGQTMHAFEMIQVYKEADKYLDSLVGILVNSSFRYAKNRVIDLYGSEEKVSRSGDGDGKYKRKIAATVATRNSSGMIRDDENILRNLYPEMTDFKRFRRLNGRHAIQIRSRVQPQDPGSFIDAMRSVKQGYVDSFTLINDNTFVLGSEWKNQFCVDLEKKCSFDMAIKKSNHIKIPYTGIMTIEEIVPIGKYRESGYTLKGKKCYRGMKVSCIEGEYVDLEYVEPDITRHIEVHGIDDVGVYLESGAYEVWEIRAEGKIWFNVDDENKFKHPNKGLYIYKNSEPRINYRSDMKIEVSPGDRVKFIFDDTKYTDNGGKYDVYIDKYKTDSEQIGIAKIKIVGDI